MKTISNPPLVTKTKIAPDFSHRPRRVNLEQLVAIKGYGKLVLRAIRPEDELEMIRFHQRISAENIYMRYFEYLGLDLRTSHDRLTKICTNSEESYAVVLERPAASRQKVSILAVGRLTRTSSPFTASFDTLIAEEKETKKMAQVLIKRNIKLARAFGFRTLTSDLLMADYDALELCRALGFKLKTLPEGGIIRVSLAL